MNNLSPIGPDDARAPAVSDFSRSANLSLAIWFNDDLFKRAQTIASYISKAEGFAPAHLIGKPEACFAVVTRALTWRLDPFAVAQSTYQPAGGAKVGFEGKLVQAILENSGRIEGGITFEHIGDWSRIIGKFEKKRSEKGRDYAVATWRPQDEDGLGVIVRAKIKGEEKPREFKFLLVQAFPRNSTMWPLDPMTQICYLAVRRFASVCAPSLLMGVPFDREDEPGMGPDFAIDVTPPRPTREDFSGPAADATAPESSDESATYCFISTDGEVTETSDQSAFASMLTDALGRASSADIADGLWESNSPVLASLPTDLADDCRAAYDEALGRLSPKAEEPPSQQTTKTAPHRLTVGVKPNGIKDYVSFCEALAVHVEASVSVDELNAWQEANLTEMDEAEKASPKAYWVLSDIIAHRGGQLLEAE